jgi:nitrate/TMAO reductase-like tetraheme cytochrome c subunit
LKNHVSEVINMKKGLLICALFMLVATFLLVDTSAQEQATTMSFVTPEGYDYSYAESCVNCHRVKGWRNRWHQENVLGVKVTRDADDVVTAVEETGFGFISSKHARSMDGASANTYCAYCHAPTYEGLTTDADEAKNIKKGKPGVACGACHPSHGQAEDFGSRYGNYMPGTDTSVNSNWKPVPKADEHEFVGKAANNQCLFCHGSYHEFASKAKTKMVKKGNLQCIDCHMAIYNHLDSGLPERYHNFKVAFNGPDSCSKDGACHSFKKKELAKEIAELFGAHTAKKHKVPKF